MGSHVSKDTTPTTINRVYTEVGAIKVFVIRGNIFHEQGDVMIWGIDRSLDLTKNRASEALVSAAGENWKTEVKKKYPGGLTSGNIAVVGAGNLSCKEIYFISLEKWNEQATQQHVLWNIIMECLNSANKSKFVSIITPAIGSGFLGYPAKVVVNSIFECIREFGLKYPETSLKIVTIAVHTEDQETYKIYTSHARSIACPGRVLTTSRANVHGSTSVKIYTGSLADWRANIIVCSCSSDLDLSNGKLTQSILQKAGSQMQDECSKTYPHGIKTGQVAVANGYNLHCKKVYFGTLSSWSGDGSTCIKELADFVDECLKLVRRYNVRSVAIPALGTGGFHYPPNVSASVIHARVEDFCQQNPSYELHIYIVIYDGNPDGKLIKQAFDQEWSSAVPLPLQVPAKPKPKPERKDTKDYFMYMYQSDPKTPRYWEKFHHKKTIKEWNGSKGDLSYKTFPVVGSALNDIKELASSTLKEQPSSGFRTIKIKEVIRLENLELFANYVNFRQTQFLAVSTGGLLTLERVQACKKGQPLTLKCTKPGCILDKNIYTEVNEYYFFHGTKTGYLAGIFQQGLDNKLAGKGLFGNGIYCAETPAKSNKYTDATGDKKMLLVRACLGDIYIHDENSYQFKRSPCKACQKDQCLCGVALFNSIVAEGTLQYREFIVHNKDQVYPEYLITYTCS